MIDNQELIPRKRGITHHIKRDTSKRHPTMNGALKKVKSPPEIPHISNNILPLSNILRFYTQDAYKQLVTAIENLASTKDDTDSVRKKLFLAVIISLREDFIKIYTLVKWSTNSKDIGKFIDLLNWLRIQESQFEQLSFELNALNGFSGAKLPNPDLITSLEVLVKGRPQLPSYNFIKAAKISPEKTLEVLQDLNLVLISRMALSDIPVRFNDYTIQDGRVVFSVANEFQVAITVGNELVISDPEDYHKSPFYFVDFKFLFGMNPETELITHADSRIVTRLPKAAHVNLEKSVNNVLLNQGLLGLYDLLHKYAVSFKLYLIAKQLKEVSLGSKWRNNLQYNYQNGKSLIVINYWSTHFLSRSWRSFIEIGIDRLYNLNFRWFKNGKYVLDHGITGLFGDVLEPQDLSVDNILNVIVAKHSEILMSKVYNSLCERIGSLNDEQDDAKVTYIDSMRLLLRLSPNKLAVFSINSATGLFYFSDPTPVQNLCTKKMNAPGKNIITERDMVSNIVDCIIQLQLETFNKEIHSRLVTTEWISNDIIKLSDFEISKLFSTSGNGSFTKFHFYRRKSWLSSWFLINLVSGLSSLTHWWVARIKSVNGEWKIQWIHQLRFGDDEGLAVEPSSLDFEFYSSLSNICSNMIIDHMIIEELQARKVQFVKLNKDHSEHAILKQLMGDKAGVLEKSISENLGKQLLGTSLSSLPIYQSTLMLFNQLLPVHNSLTCLFLQITLLKHHNITSMQLKLYGTLRNLTLKHSPETFANLNLKIDPARKYFEIFDTVNLSSTIVEGDKEKNPHHLLDRIFNSTSKLNELIKILDQLHRNHIEVVSNAIDDIRIRIDDNEMLIQIPDNGGSIKLVHDSEDGLVRLLLVYLNRYLSDNYHENNSLESKGSIVGIIRYLKEVNPIIKSVNLIKLNFRRAETSIRLPNGLNKVNFDVKIANLNLIQYIYYMNYQVPNSSKKIFKDKIIITLMFKKNKFATTGGENMIKVSLKDNFNLKNIKYKKLFELIFKEVNEIEQLTKKLIKLNYDFLVEKDIIQEVMVRISNCFVAYLKLER